MSAKDILASKSKKKKPLINISAIKGEPGTGYESLGKLGPFECANCEYFHAGGCNQKDMKKLSKQPRLANGLVKVDPHGCCEMIDRVGRKNSDKD